MTATVRQPRKTLPGVIVRSKWLPPKACIYGTPGVGKSTFGAGAPDPIFIPTEAGIENLDVARFPVARSVGEFLANLQLVADGDHEYKSVVIDTLNGVMDLYHQDRRDNLDFDNFGGSRGWQVVATTLKTDVLPLLDACQRRGMFVILLAHAGEYTRNNPLGDNLIVAAPSIPKWVWKELHGALDVIGRADYVYSTSSAGKPGKAKGATDTEDVGGVRVKVRRLTFDGGVEMDCKTRVGYELPPEMPLSWEVFAAHLGNIKALAQEIRDLWRHIAPDKAGPTLAWLGVSSLADEQLTKANRSKLSQLRNRLLEAKAEAEAAKAAEPAPAPEAPPAATETPAVPPNAILWTRDGCPRCAAEQARLAAAGYAVEVRDVSRIEADRDSDAMAQLTIQGGALPVVWADGKFVDIAAGA